MAAYQQISIDPALCNGDGLCVAVCPSAVFRQSDAGETPSVARPSACIACGHCVAVCPTDAVRHGQIDLAASPLVGSQPAVTAEQALHFMRRRRSERHFKDNEVTRDLLEKLVEAGRFAPSASNAQVYQFIVVQDRARIRRLARLSLGPFRLALRLIENPMARGLARPFAGKALMDEAESALEDLRAMVNGPSRGQDLVLFDAPALILIHAPKGASFGETDCANAQHQMALMAEALGLGTTTIGFFIIAFRFSRALRRELRLPKGHRLYGTLIVGWPRYRWRRVPDRRPARVRWE